MAPSSSSMGNDISHISYHYLEKVNMGYFVQTVTFVLCWIFAKGFDGVLALASTDAAGHDNWVWALMMALPFYSVAAIAAQIHIVRPYRERQRQQPWCKGD